MRSELFDVVPLTLGLVEKLLFLLLMSKGFATDSNDDEDDGTIRRRLDETILFCAALENMVLLKFIINDDNVYLVCVCDGYPATSNIILMRCCD